MSDSDVKEVEWLPATVQDGVVYCSNDDGDLLAIDTEDGTLLWSRDLNQWVGEDEKY